MRSAGCLTVGALVVLLFGTMLGSLDMLSEVEPVEVSVSRYRQVKRSEGSTGPPLFAALIERFQALESVPEPLLQADAPPLIPSTAQLLLLRSEAATPALLAIHQTLNTSITYSSFPLNVSTWQLEDLFWQEMWTVDLPGPVLNTAKCYTEQCAAVVYRSIRGTEYVDRIRLWPQPENGLYDDFELPGTGRISAITLSNDTIAYHRFQGIQPFTFLSKVPAVNLSATATLYKHADYAWVCSTVPVQGLSSNDVVGLQYARVLETNWMVVTTSYLPPSMSYTGPDGVISTHLLHQSESQWKEFTAFDFNYTFSPLLFPRQSLSYSVSPHFNTSLQVSLVSYPLQHFFLVYQWRENTVSLRHLDLASDVFPRFHVSEPMGEFGLLVGEEIVLLRKWREGGSMYQSIFQVNLEGVEEALGSQEVKEAYIEQIEEGL
jgi:hypothetical protein